MSAAGAAAYACRIAARWPGSSPARSGNRGDADGESTKIYASAYERDPEFYSFLNSLASYRASLESGTTLVLTTKMDYLRYLQDLSPPR